MKLLNKIQRISLITNIGYWTSEPPSDIGWYWGLAKWGDILPVLVDNEKDEETEKVIDYSCWVGPDSEKYGIEDFTLWFNGKIEEPPVPQTINIVDQREAQFNALLAFWKHMLRRIERDANIQYYCGAMTETLRLCLDAYIALYPDSNRDAIEKAVLETNASSDADVLRLRETIERIKGQGY